MTFLRRSYRWCLTSLASCVFLFYYLPMMRKRILPQTLEDVRMKRELMTESSRVYLSKYMQMVKTGQVHYATTLLLQGIAYDPYYATTAVRGFFDKYPRKTVPYWLRQCAMVLLDFYKQLEDCDPQNCSRKNCCQQTIVAIDIFLERKNRNHAQSASEVFH